MDNKKINSFAPRLQQMLGIAVATELQGTPHEGVRLIVNPGESRSYMDLVKTIVIGLKHPTFAPCKTEEDYYEVADYIRGHETQHKLSTTKKSWDYAIKRGAEVVVENLCKAEGIYLRLTCDHDYEVALEKLAAKGIRLKMSTLFDLTKTVANCLEDGRIEAIRASHNEMFKKQMLHIRLREWHDEPIPNEVPTYDKATPLIKVQIVMNQILTLATFSLYQKGYTEKYFKTPLQARVEDVKPLIKKGITSPTCRGMAECSIKICEKLSDMIAEAAKMTDFDKAMEEFIKELIKNMEEPPQCSDAEEEEGEGIKIPFPVSDMNDDGDSSNQDAKSSGSKDDDAKDSKESTSEGKGQRGKESADDASDSGNDANDSDSSDSEKSEGNGQDSDSNGDSSDDKGTEGEDSGKDDDESKDKGNKKSEFKGDSFGENSKDEREVQCSNSDKNEANDKGNSPMASPQGKDMKSGKSDGETGEKAPGGPVDEKAIEKAMEDAAKAAAGTTADTVSAMDALTRRHKNNQSMTQDVQERVEPTPQAVIDEINSHYKGSGMTLTELNRAYEVDEEIPSWLCVKIDALAKKLEALFSAKKRRFRRQLLDGKLDSSRVAMLAANEIDVFKHVKESKDVKACAEILVDNSGSMGYGQGSKREAACVALTMIEMVFAKYFPIKIFAFDVAGSVIHEVIKNWNEHFSRSGAWNFLMKGRYGSGNMDGYSIRVATADILGRPEKKKLIVVLSDGAPDSCKDVKEAVKEARDKGIRVVGIFFSDWEEDLKNPKFFIDMYGEKDSIICEPGEIGDNLVKTLRDFFA